MRMISGFLTDFHSVRPRYETTQEDCLDWILSAHTKAEAIKRGQNPEQLEDFRNELKAQLFRVGCKPHSIHKRGHEIDDFLHRDWQKMRVYRLEEFPQGIGLQARQEVHAEIAEGVFEKFYAPVGEPPENMIHVSCTGYASPSAAQKLVSKRRWGSQTLVTHAYHMGCYGAISAVRMGMGFTAQCGKRSDIVHTELCTLHMNPALHDLDQLVGQSLFADGFIKYSVSVKEPGLKILGFHEQIIPDSLAAMTWLLNDWGFRFLLTKEIPVFIARHIGEYLENLSQKTGVASKALLEEGLFAVHPGGPKILQYIQQILGLREEQLEKSREVMQNCGNMSSGTLPHIWESILNDSKIASGTRIVSLAFGPGLSIAGNILEKC